MVASAGQIRTGASQLREPSAAVAEIHAKLHMDDVELVVLFCSSRYDRAVLAHEIRERFGAVPVIGCTTAGEISPAGYREGGISGFSLGAAEFTAALEVIEPLRRFGHADGARVASALRTALEARHPGIDGSNTFGFLLVDGLSRREEPVTGALHANLVDIPLFGGSAADDMAFESTGILAGGEFRADRAVVALIRTDRPFRAFRTQHFVSSERRLVVTRADSRARVVHEFDGMPAADAYAAALGLEVADLASAVFACHPVVVKMGEECYVRSIMRMREDRSMVFACAIDEGVVVRPAEGVDMVANLESAMRGLRAQIGPPELLIGCDCIFRLVEAREKRLVPDVERILLANNAVGFATYGEQYNAAHHNQTLTGVAIGRAAGAEPAGTRP